MREKFIVKAISKMIVNQFVGRPAIFVQRIRKIILSVGLPILVGISSTYFANAQDNIRYTQGEVNDSSTLSLGVPLSNYPGRGINLPISLNYSSAVWKIDHRDNSRGWAGVSLPQTVTQASYADYSKAGWKSSLDLPVIEWPKSTDTYSYDGKPGNVCATYRIAKVTIHMPDGSTHELRKSDTPYNSGSIDMSGTFYAVDSSRIRFDATGSNTGTIYTPDGTRYVLDTSYDYIIDKNGNTLTYNKSNGQWTDTLGRVFVNPIPASPAAQDYTYTLPGLSGVSPGGVQTYTFKWRELEDVLTPDESNNTPDLRYIAAEYLPYPSSPAVGYPSYTNYPTAQSSAHGHLFQSAYTYNEDGDPSLLPTLLVGKDQAQSQLFNPIVLSEIVLPDGTKYKFTYNIFGEIDKVVYPTNAYDKYVYETPADSGDANSQQPYIQSERRINSRKLSVDGAGDDILEWKYIQQDVHGWLKIIAPDNTRTEILKAANGYNSFTRFGFVNSIVGVTLERRAYSTSSNGLGGTMLRRELFEYAQTSHNVSVSGTCGQTPYNFTKTAYRNPRPTKSTSLVFEGSGSALGQTDTYSYDTTYELSTGVDQNGVNTYGFAVISHSSAETDPIGSISSGSLVKVSSTTYETGSGYRGLNILGLPLSVTIYDGSYNIASRNEMLYDESSYVASGSGTRGLPTTLRSWDSTKGVYSNSSAYLATHSTFDTYGNRTVATDAMGNTTTTTFDSTYHVYPVSITSPVPDSSGTYGSSTAFTTTTSYDTVTGLALSVTDNNSQTATMEYNDALLRPTKITDASGHQTTMEYGAGTSESTRWVKIKSQIDSTNWGENTRYYDGLGRTYKSRKKDTGGDVISETHFDNMGRVSEVSNPYRDGTSSGNIKWTVSDYDDLGRKISVTSPDNAVFSSEFGLSVSGVIGKTLKHTDQSGKSRQGFSDALGNMVRVIEDPASQALVTDYVFDTMGNLRKTTQGSQSRYFYMDSLGKPLYVRQVEQNANSNFSGSGYADPITGNNQWSTKYEYDDNGNITKATGPNNNYTQGTYDHLNRMTYRNYSDSTPDVNYYYDGKGLTSTPSNSKGRMTKITSSVSENRYTNFDAMGRLLSDQQITDGQTYTFGYTYNLGGDLIEETYPSGRVVKNTLDPNGALEQVQSRQSGKGYWTYASAFTYNAAGLVEKMQLGNGKWETATYNDRLQMTQIGLGSLDNNQNMLKLQYSYGTTDNNGSMQSQTITVPTMGAASGFTATQAYTYDSLNRLGSAAETVSSTQTWKQTFTYDRYGNRSFDTTSGNTTTIPGGCSTAVCNPTFDSGTNRYSSGQSYTYDANGAVTQDALGQRFGYDGDSKQKEFFVASNGTSTPDATYSYDPNGERVKKVSATETTIFVYDSKGQLAAEYSTALPQTPKVAFITSDNLGSPRLTTDQNGAVTLRKDYTSFGEESFTAQRTTGLGYATSDELRQDFAGYQKDDESGLEFAKARYYKPGHGRFTSVDPLTSSANVRNPQTFNRYAYVTNSPYKFVDPLGLMLSDIGVVQTSSGFLADMLERQSISEIRRDMSSAQPTSQAAAQPHPQASATPQPAQQTPQQQQQKDEPPTGSVGITGVEVTTIDGKTPPAAAPAPAPAAGNQGAATGPTQPAPTSITSGKTAEVKITVATTSATTTPIREILVEVKQSDNTSVTSEIQPGKASEKTGTPSNSASTILHFAVNEQSDGSPPAAGAPISRSVTLTPTGSGVTTFTAEVVGVIGTNGQRLDLAHGATNPAQVKINPAANGGAIKFAVVQPPPQR